MMLKSYRYILVALIPLIFSNCAQKQEKIEFIEPKFQIPAKKKVVKRKKGSLYTRKGPSLFADKKDLQIGDILQVVIDESLQSNTNSKRDLSSDSTGALGAGTFSYGGGNKVVGEAARVANQLTNVGFSSTSSSEFVGETKTKLAENFSTTISVIIEQTYQNGNYFIKGSKEMLIDGQKQDIVISGVIRPYDITPDNSVSSSQVANLKVMYKKDGEENDVLHTPWGLKLLKQIWPF